MNLNLIIGLTIGLIAVVFAHEMGHLVMAKILNIPVKRISLGLGPVLWQHQITPNTKLVMRLLPVSVAIGVPGRYDANNNLRRPETHDMLVAIAGPVASVALAGTLYALALAVFQSPIVQLWLLALAALSLAAGLLNLIPVPGLDGGHLLLLGLARFGLRLSPSQEVKAHNTGLRLLTALVMLLTLARIAVRV